MHCCNCTSFEDIELTRDAINQRCRATKSLKISLKLVAEHPDGEHQLFKCPQCGQLWQRSRAWNWGNKEYLFRVPIIAYSEWITEPFVQPDALLIFAADVRNFLTKQSFELTGRPCRQDDCNAPAIKHSAFCKRHHIRSLQSAHLLSQTPVGRWFPPYAEANFTIGTERG